MEYKIDIDENYYLDVKKRLSTSAFDGELMVSVSVCIQSKTDYFYIILVNCIYENKWFDFIFRTTWEDRVHKAEKKLINKAKKNIKRLPTIRPVISTRS